MQTKGDLTRQTIIEQSAILFNKKGFSGTAMSDIMDVTGLHKGGIYNHFKSKDDIALAAFDYAFARIQDHMHDLLKDIDSPLQRLILFIKSFTMYYNDPVIAGGCPILNTAIDADDTHPALRAKALDALAIWEKVIQRRLEKAIACGEAKPDTDIPSFASLSISALEGAVMLSHIHNDFSHLQRVITHLVHVIERDIRQ